MAVISEFFILSLFSSGLSLDWLIVVEEGGVADDTAPDAGK